VGRYDRGQLTPLPGGCQGWRPVSQLHHGLRMAPARWRPWGA